MLREHGSFSTWDPQPKFQSTLISPGQQFPEIEQLCRTRSGKHDTAVGRHGVAFDGPPISKCRCPCDLPLSVSALNIQLVPYMPLLDGHVCSLQMVNLDAVMAILRPRMVALMQGEMILSYGLKNDGFQHLITPVPCQQLPSNFRIHGIPWKMYLAWTEKVCSSNG